jgi:hypothetical protein
MHSFSIPMYAFLITPVFTPLPIFSSFNNTVHYIFHLHKTCYPYFFLPFNLSILLKQEENLMCIPLSLQTIKNHTKFCLSHSTTQQHFHLKTATFILLLSLQHFHFLCLISFELTHNFINCKYFLFCYFYVVFISVIFLSQWGYFAVVFVFLDL